MRAADLSKRFFTTGKLGDSLQQSYTFFKKPQLSESDVVEFRTKALEIRDSLQVIKPYSEACIELRTVAP
ncbi:hypothetical protein [Ectobacillus panaciterrae]|uniref:hypothetical protein n=1 Tax=Ectobacillus panaciterrae TaxID=363872 RepID=UPI0003FC4AF5|nr:hypothetical protein [Ectobacillus panaciterrae]